MQKANKTIRISEKLGLSSIKINIKNAKQQIAYKHIK